ncbi:NAD(P)H-dependent oxidoreductase [Hyunsoonleella pacifica]|uniref:NAD(P)H-dependent oxidoreductase n=1 Tax=Hyunsoonleella pacifica TaxID=1080224 RepID=A0A4Q9FSL9_9FLAO|nr:NAD(P)H-dependent oxidoreductase [Hyunsoonleella pacifica]TBN18967.1 NAD(P)H-dependent oxidoreductase [Hyunsoonleella pacifica]GGD06198.1 NAD(P)H-dependent oxidoreductase [Hyunsoonleella pacifica]
MSNIIEQLQWRYATKKFDDTKTLPNDKLDILKQAFNLTATSYGLQTIKMLVIKDKTLRLKLVKHSYNQSQVVDASHLLVICIQENILTADVNQYYDNIKDIRETPENILKPYRDGLLDMMSKMSIEERQKWSTNQAYIALGNLMTVCAIEHIDACPMEGFVPQKFNEILNLEAKGLKSVLLLPVGYRAKDDMFSEFKKVRKPITEAVIEL